MAPRPRKSRISKRPTCCCVSTFCSTPLPCGSRRLCGLFGFGWCPHSLLFRQLAERVEAEDLIHAIRRRHPDARGGILLDPVLDDLGPCRVANFDARPQSFGAWARAWARTGAI